MTTATGYSGLWGASLVLKTDRSPLERAMTRIARRTDKNTELMLTLNGASAGSAALSQQTRVAHSTSELGGSRSVETRNIVNRNTTAADKTAIDGILVSSSRIATPVDAAGDWAA